MKTILICGATGFIGRNLLNFYSNKDYKIRATHFKRPVVDGFKNVEWVKCDLRNPEDVKKVTGYTIGGVSPTGHLIKTKIFIDENLKNFDSIFAAAGHPNAVFKIDFESLKSLTSGVTKEITE